MSSTAVEPSSGDSNKALSNSLGIPAASFVENVEEFMKNETSADDALRKMQSNYSTYKLIEMKLNQSKTSLKNKLPDIQKALEMVHYLASKSQGDAESGVTTHFEVSEGIYASAKLQNTGVVCLWLGANVMVEYSYTEAIALLTKNMEGAKKTINTIEEDLNFLKDQITTTEVNIARIFNYDVKQRRQARGGT